MTDVQSFIADFLHASRLVDDGTFALKAARAIAGTRRWDVDAVAASLNRLKSSLFKRNTKLRKPEFTQRLATQIIRNCEKPTNEASTPIRSPSLDQSVHFHAPVNARVLQTGQNARAVVRTGPRTMLAKRVEPAYLDALSVISKVAPTDVKEVSMPLSVKEVSVRAAFEKLLGESFHATDSGVESCDMFTVQGTHRGTESAVAAMFKGAGNKSLRWPLQVGGCGKNGNQVVKLFEVPADVYIIQANGPFDPTLVKHVQDTADAHTARGRTVRYMLLDGVTTARLLRATRTGLV